MSTPADIFTADLLIELHKQFHQYLRCWRNNRAKVKVLRENGRVGWMDAGIDGQADISGLLAPRGRRLEIEVKVGKDQLREDQERFRNAVVSLGAVYIEAREMGQTLAEVRKAIEEEQSMPSVKDIIDRNGGLDKVLDKARQEQKALFAKREHKPAPDDHERTGHKPNKR